MKQTTKVLLPLGLFMSIVIPITVKSLFTETDFFDFNSDESTKVDYLQPYQPKPENSLTTPKMHLNVNGVEIEINDKVIEAAKGYYKQSHGQESKGVSQFDPIANELELELSKGENN